MKGDFYVVRGPGRRIWVRRPFLSYAEISRRAGVPSGFLPSSSDVPRVCRCRVSWGKSQSRLSDSTLNVPYETEASRDEERGTSWSLSSYKGHWVLGVLRPQTFFWETPVPPPGILPGEESSSPLRAGLTNNVHHQGQTQKERYTPLRNGSGASIRGEIPKVSVDNLLLRSSRGGTDQYLMHEGVRTTESLDNLLIKNNLWTTLLHPEPSLLSDP